MNRLLAAALAVLLLPPAARAAGDAAPEPSVLVGTAPPRQGTLDQALTAYGTAQPAPGDSINISFLRAGQVLQLRVAPGQPVRPGDTLLLFGADPAALMAFSQAQSALALARDERARIARMVEQRLATQSQLDQADKAVRDAESAVQALTKQGGGSALDEVKAPFAGVVTSVTVANGDRVQPGTTVLQLAKSDGLLVRLGIMPEARQRVAAGQAVRLSALDQPGAPIAGTVVSVGGMLDTKTQLVEAVVAPAPGAGAGLMPGEHVSAAIAVGQLRGWIVPRAAVLSDGDGPYVFQVADHKAVRVPAKILGEAGDQMAIDGAIDPARALVVSGNYQLAPGMAVREASAPGPAEAAPVGAVPAETAPTGGGPVGPAQAREKP